MADTEALVKKAETNAIAIKSDVALLVKMEAGLEIVDGETNGKAGDILKSAKAKQKWLVDDRKAITKHFDEAKSIVMAKYAPELEECEKLEERVLRKMKKYEEEERKRIEEVEKQRKAAELAQLERQKKEVLDTAAEDNSEDLLKAAEEIEQQQEAIKTAPVEKVVVKASGSISQTGWRDNWKFEIVNEALVPIEFKSTDEKKVKEKIKYGVREIPGLRIYNDRVPISR